MRAFPYARSMPVQMSMPRLALANLVANVGIVVTGGLVRLTGSGLGCPTWPQCTSGSYVPTEALAGHGRIEFTNRMLTFVLAAVTVATLVAATRATPRRPALVRLATVVLLGIPAQAVLGGITVLTGLNPWTVMAHFLLSAAIIGVAFVLWLRSREETDGPTVPVVREPLPLAGRLAAAAAGLSLMLGTVVTGSGPHAGDPKAGRTGFDPQNVAQLHVDVVLLLVGLTIGVWIGLVATDAPKAPRSAVTWLLAAEVAQAAVGFVQYFTHLPVPLVTLHMLGACLVWIAALRLPLAMRSRDAATDRDPGPVAAARAVPA